MHQRSIGVVIHPIIGGREAEEIHGDVDVQATVTLSCSIIILHSRLSLFGPSRL